MPQFVRYYNISEKKIIFMSTILVQKESESKQTLVQQTIEKLPIKLEKVETSFKAIDFAGLSWLLLEYGDEI